jgi:hypothetical protein
VFIDDQRIVGTTNEGAGGRLQDTVFELEAVGTGRLSWQELVR